MITIWNTIFYEPLYNALVFLTNILPGADVGLAVILLTVIVKFILFPFTQKTIESQARMRMLEPEIARVKEMYPNKEEQGKKMLELYKTHKVNPFSGCLIVILVQLPIIIALYRVFSVGLTAHPDVLYSFIKQPAEISMNFLGFIDLSVKSIGLAFLAGITQFIQGYLSNGRQKNVTPAKKTEGFQADLAKSMRIQMLYVFPILVVVFGFSIAAAVTLYWVTNNVFTIIQELFIHRKLEREGIVIQEKITVK
jgi:YidC/Oxa1 family membrane protein insertase